MYTLQALLLVFFLPFEEICYALLNFIIQILLHIGFCFFILYSPILTYLSCCMVQFMDNDTIF